MSQPRGDIPVTLISKDSIMQGAYVCRCPYAEITGYGVVGCTKNGGFCYKYLNCSYKGNELRASKEDLEYQQSRWYRVVPHKKSTAIINLSVFDQVELCFSNFLYPNVHSIVVPLVLEIINKNEYEKSGRIKRVLKDLLDRAQRFHKKDNPELIKILTCIEDYTDMWRLQFENIPRIELPQKLSQELSEKQEEKKFKLCDICKSRNYCTTEQDNERLRGEPFTCQLFNYEGDYYTFQQDYCKKICKNNSCGKTDEIITHCLAQLGDLRAKDHLRTQERLKVQGVKDSKDTTSVKLFREGNKITLVFKDKDKADRCFRAFSLIDF